MTGRRVDIVTPEFWIALMQIIGVNIVLSGDNAVVIALAARGLPADCAEARRVGHGAAVVMRIALTIVAVELLRRPYLKLVGAALLLWIAVQLLIPEEEGHGDIQPAPAWRGDQDDPARRPGDEPRQRDRRGGGSQGQHPCCWSSAWRLDPAGRLRQPLLLVLMDRFPVIITLGRRCSAGSPATWPSPIRSTSPGSISTPRSCIGERPWGAAVLSVSGGKWLAARLAAAAMPAVALVPALVTDPFRRLLLAVDGSPAAEQARRVIALRQQLRERDVQVHLINVQRPLPGDVTSFVGGKPVEEYHRERSDEAMAPARALLGSAGVPFEEHHLVGLPGPTIARVAHETGCHMIIMGVRGLGTHRGGVGSVAQATLEHASVPVLMVK